MNDDHMFLALAELKPLMVQRLLLVVLCRFQAEMDLTVSLGSI